MPANYNFDDNKFVVKRKILHNLTSKGCFRLIKRKTKAISILFFCLMMCFAVSGQVQAYDISGFYQYEINDNKVTITRYTGGELEVNIPSKIGGKVVAEIGRDAFNNNDLIEKVNIPATVTTIARGAFYDCDSLIDAAIPDSVAILSSDAFNQCDNLKSVKIGNGVKRIDNSCFEKCTNLTKVTIGNSVEEIGEWAFSNCDSLTDITVPASVKKLYRSSFEDCDSLQNVNLTNGLNLIDRGTFYKCKELKKIIIPDSVTEIGMDAFRYCSNLTSLDIGDGVRIVGDSSFEECTNLRNVSIGNSVEYIGEWAFHNCDNLTSLIIPSSVKELRRSCFEDCDSLTDVTLSYGLDVIARGVFYNCKNLQGLNIPNSVRAIGYDAFSNSERFQQLTIPNSVTTIDDEVAVNCNNLSISGFAGSKAEGYAKEKGFPFIVLPAIPSTGISFPGKEILLMEEQKYNLDYSILPNNTTDAIIWKSSNYDLVDVDNVGMITAKRAGSVSIVATTTSGKKASITIIVKEGPKSLTFQNPNKVLAVGQAYTQKAVVDTGRTDVSITYSSDNSSVAAVSSTGAITAKKAGTTTIRARIFNGLECSYVITVREAPSTVAFSKPAVSLKVKQTYTLQVKIPEGTYTYKYTYTSSNPKVATVNASGKIVAVKKGTAVITVTTHNGKKAACTVTVK